MKSIHKQLRFGYSIGLLSAAVLWLSVPAWGQTAPADGTAVAKPTVTVERQGRLLVLSYRLVGTDGQPITNAPSSRPEFTIHKGNRKIASGKFEYG